jgi:hypothetical protein
MSASVEEGDQDDDDILGFPGDGFEDTPEQWQEARKKTDGLSTKSRRGQ